MWHYVYSLQTDDKKHWYVGKTTNIKRRLSEHNSGHSIHTRNFKNWELISFTGFRNELPRTLSAEYPCPTC
ncbi:GIY-YIG nuclease family protein [Patescibacteria group bacterium]|nr:GIY-YIG nuclease family protein [Patescibacteria group bacterium]MBU2259577.1 GIY-YIG nuclease family protein [Patescibacteria group bacterium]